MRKPNTEIVDTVTIAPSQQVTNLPFTATFTIITNGLKRDFTNARYHNQSEDVYITRENPQTVHVTKEGITWGDFFSTLPMKVTNECLTTGTGQVFCTGTNGTLRFYLNEISTPRALEMIISPNDSLIIEYEAAEIQPQSTQSATQAATSN